MLKADAFILAAGFGTRLKPLTETTPKPLIPCAGKELIAWNIELLIEAGFKRVIVNTHYLPEKVENYLLNSSFAKEIEFIIVKEPEILGTGGGIKNIHQYLQHKTLLTINSDVVLDRNFKIADVINSHAADTERAATMMLREDKNSKSYGEIGIDEAGNVKEFLNESFFENEPDSKILKRLMYTGVQVLDKSVFNYMPCDLKQFSITKDVYPSMLSSGEKVGSYVFEGYWNDAGTHERLAEAEAYLSENIVDGDIASQI